MLGRGHPLTSHGLHCVGLSPSAHLYMYTHTCAQATSRRTHAHSARRDLSIAIIFLFVITCSQRLEVKSLLPSPLLSRAHGMSRNLPGGARLRAQQPLLQGGVAARRYSGVAARGTATSLEVGGWGCTASIQTLSSTPRRHPRPDHTAARAKGPLLSRDGGMCLMAEARARKALSCQQPRNVVPGGTDVIDPRALQQGPLVSATSDCNTGDPRSRRGCCNPP